MHGFNFIDWDEKKEITAVFVGLYPSIGKFKRAVYVFREGKAIKHSWSTVQLFNLLSPVPFGTKLKITYLGKEKMPDSSYLFKNFSVEILEPPKDKKKR